MHRGATGVTRTPYPAIIRINGYFGRDKSHAFADIVKLAALTCRTRRRSPRAEISVVAMLEHNLRHIEHSLPHVAELALGGTGSRDRL